LNSENLKYFNSTKFQELNYNENDFLHKYNDRNNRKLSMRNIRNFERLEKLYEKGKIKNEMNKLLLNKKLEIKEKEELNECTFKPFLYKNFHKSIRTNEKSPEGDFYERLSNWQNKLDLK
jgi:hypothetical protein